MPEIAEVETVRNTLKKRILNKKIIAIKINYPNIILSDIDEFKSILKNNEFKDIKRCGKWLIFELKNHYLLSHLRMEGKYFIKDTKENIGKHEHVIFTFNDGTDLRYHDTRKFGRMKLIKKAKLNSTIEIKKLGIEPLDLTENYIYKSIHFKKIPMKTILLDQTIINGLGNIYADEVLFASLINPKRLGSDVTLAECKLIKENAKRIILKAIEEGGTTIKSYTSSLGIIGNYQNYLQVHKREDMPCPRCGTKIKKIKVGGRSTYFCENCQK